MSEKHPFIGKQSQIAERKTVWSWGRETAVKRVKNPHNKSPRPTPLTAREHVGGGSRGKSPDYYIYYWI